MRRLLTSSSIIALACSASWADVTYNGFSSTAGLTLNAAAATATTTDGTVLRVTPAVGTSAGSAFSTVPVSASNFTSIFSFRITDPGGTIFDNNTEVGADGLVFVVQNIANNVGTAGAGIGYDGIGSSVGVEFDTWGNNGNNDPSQSHIGIDLNGSVVHGGAGQGPTVNIGDTNAPNTALPGPELDDGNRWWAWVYYNGTAMDVYMKMDESSTEPVRPADPLLSHPFNLQSTLGGSSTAYAGFTSGTGADWANHDIIYWRYTESIPEPASIALLAPIAVTLRRRR